MTKHVVCTTATVSEMYDRNFFAVFDGKTHPFYKHVPACPTCMYLHMAVDL